MHKHLSNCTRRKYDALTKPDLSVSRTRHADGNWTGRTMPWQANYSHVVTEIFAAKLCTDANRPRQLQNLFLQFRISETTSMLIT